jgi:F-type H+-transporting ATPase subunit alpha
MKTEEGPDSTRPGEARSALARVFTTVDTARRDFGYGLTVSERGEVRRLTAGVARVSGLPGVGFEELVEFGGGALGLVRDLDVDDVGVMLLDDDEQVSAGSVVRRTHRIMDVPVGETLLGRVVDPAGRPLDDLGPVRERRRRHTERRPPAIRDRAPVERPLQTGIKAIDALVPIGRGQRELIIGDRQTGKTSIAIDTILNQRDDDVISVYCAVGQQTSAVAKVVARLRERGALDRTIVVVASSDDPVGLRFVAPYAATTMGEYFMDAGRDVLIIYDDLTRHARAYREVSLLLRRPPGREAYPGDIFYIHSRLLERASHLRPELGGGSLTALPIVETQAEDLAAYIPTNLVSITDGQVYVSPRLFRRGQLPAVDAGRSVSRVGDRAQLPAYRSVGNSLRLFYAQFEELERFSRYGARLEAERRQELERGRRVREALKQADGDPRTVMEQLLILVAVAEGALDDVPVSRIAEIENELRYRANSLPELRARIERGEPLTDDDIRAVVALARELR